MPKIKVLKESVSKNGVFGLPTAQSDQKKDIKKNFSNFCPEQFSENR